MLDNLVHFHTEPKDFMNSVWNNYGYYYFRNYNELPHIASQRLYLALNDAVNFSNSFKRIEYDTIQRFLIFLIGSVTSFIIFMGFYNEAILSITFLNRNMWWYVAILTASIAILKNNLVNQNFNQNPRMYLVKLEEHIGCKLKPDMKLKQTYLYISKFLKYKFFNLFLEIMSIFLTPYFLIIHSKKNARKLGYWLKDNLEKDDDLGYIYKNCNFKNNNSSDMMKQSIINYNKFYE